MFWAFCNYTLESKTTFCIKIFRGEKYKSPKDRELQWLDDLLVMANNPFNSNFNKIQIVNWHN